MSRIEISQARKVYSGNVTALHGIDLTVASGEMLVLVGPSGCGKSTLLRMIAGLESVTSGAISIDGQIVNDIEPAARDIAMVFQNYALYPHMSVRGNLEYGLKNRGIASDERRRLVEEAARVLELEPFLDRKPAALSGGQRQRVAMGRAIVRKPRAFLFDEPLSNLDAKLRGQMRVEIRRLQRELGTTSVFVTHDQLEAMTLADRLAVMRDGRIEQVGTPFEVYHQPATSFVARFIGSPGMNIFHRDELLAAGAVLPESLPYDRALLGFRPEEVRLGWKGDGLKFSGRVSGVELLGPETLAHIHLNGLKNSLVARVNGYHADMENQLVDLEVPRSELHSFVA